MPKTLQNFIREFASLHISLYAANAAFFLLLSCFPLSSLLLTLLRYLPVTQQDLFALLEPLLPSALLPFVKAGAADVSVYGLVRIISFNVITTLWASSKGLHSLIFGLNRVNHATETRGYFKRRFLCLGYTLLLLIALLLTLLLHVFGRRLLDLLGVGVPLFAAFLLTAFISVLYLVLPNRKTPLRRALPGASCAAVAWLIFSALFSYYVNHYAARTANDTITAVLLGTLWLYFCMAILLCGAYLNRLIFRFPRQNG